MSDKKPGQSEMEKDVTSTETDQSDEIGEVITGGADNPSETPPEESADNQNAENPQKDEYSGESASTDGSTGDGMGSGTTELGPSEIAEVSQESQDEIGSVESSVEDGKGDQQGIGFDEVLQTKAGQNRKKWFIFAVGGCGNNLLDAIYMRKSTLGQEKDPREVIWEGGIEGIVNTNTNNKEIRRSYYVHEISDQPPERYANNFAFPGDGAGVDESLGDELAEDGFQDGIVRDWDVQPGRADAIMLLHSAVKGTGSGATPRIARQLDVDLRKNKDTAEYFPIYSCVVLPERIEGMRGDYEYDNEEDEILAGNRFVENTTVSLARLAGKIEVIIPFQNQNLKPATDSDRGIPTLPQANLGDHSPVNFQEHYEHNQTLVSFIETLTMTAVPEDETKAGYEIEGAGSFDVIDPYQPARSLNPNDYEENERPALVFAPAHARTAREKFETQATIKQLLNNLVTNKLATFDHTTAWGCSIMFYGSEAGINSLSSKAGYIKTEITRMCDGARSGFRDFNVVDYYLTIPEMDGVRVWAGFWNPEMQLINDCKTFVDNRADDKSRVSEFEEEFNRLCNNLGRGAFQ